MLSQSKKGEDICMIIEVPDWCKIGKFIEFKMYNPDTQKVEWFRDKIIAYSEDGFFHQAAYCPVYYNKFSDFGTTVRNVDIKKNNLFIIK